MKSGGVTDKPRNRISFQAYLEEEPRGYLTNKNVKYQKGTFITVPNKHHLAGQSPVTQVLFMWICSFADENGVCHPSRETLRKCVGVNSVRTIDKHLTILCQLGLLSKAERVKNQEKMTNLYQVELKEKADFTDGHLLQGVEQQLQGVGQPLHGGSAIDARGVEHLLPIELNPVELNPLNSRLGSQANRPAPEGLERKEISYPKDAYVRLIEEYQRLKGIELKGKEFLPVQQTIKSMFMSERTVDEIFECMQWLAQGDEVWKENWTIRTVALKLPE